ncbi:MAG: hypothetical protein ACI8TP_004000 [Acidimicrobiales bacterium]|jgi:hypothetical protein
MSPTFAAIDVVDVSRLPEFLLGLSFNVAAISALALLTFRRSQARALNVFTLVVVNIVVFFVTYLMASAAVSTNVGFGLFALFGILRFRTGTLPVLDMTYLFAGIALASFNALALVSLTLVEALIANFVIIGVLEILGGVWLSRQPKVHSIVYERIELVHPERRQDLIADLESRTGLAIQSVTVHDLNFLNDTANLSVEVRARPTNDRLLVHVSSERYER